MVVPTPPLAPATAISWPPSAPAADSSPATRSRIVRDHCEAARTLDSSCSSESGSATTSRSPACIAARSTSGESSAAISTRPISGKLEAMSRATSSTGTAPSASCRTTTSTSSRRSARASSSASADPVDDLQLLALAGERRRALRELGVGDREQQAVLGHLSSGRV